jgi:hypothetical protein
MPSPDTSDEFPSPAQREREGPARERGRVRALRSCRSALTPPLSRTRERESPGGYVSRCLRQVAGGTPNSRLKARLNAASDSYPTS